MAITLKYNNIPSASATSFVTFSDVPNLVEIDNDADGFALAMCEFEILNGWSEASHVDPWYISINGETVTGVENYKNAINKNFFISSDENSTAASLCKALRNCPSLAASFEIRNYDNYVELLARNKGEFTWDIETNATDYLSIEDSDGTVGDKLIGGKVEVDIIGQDGKYITTLEKNYYETGMMFDITPVLSTMAKPGKTSTYKLKVAATKNSGEYITIGTISGNSIAQGYQVNQGFNYIPLGNMPYDFIIAQNVSRGTDKSWDNNTALYLYGNTIPVSWYSKSKSSITCEVQYLSSAYAAVHTDTVTLSDSSNGWLHNATVTLSESYKTSAYFIGLIFTDSSDNTLGTLMYSIIKPLKATEYYQRIYWRNSYGGVSFFDFTASKSESREVETTTYNKNVYDYYTQDVNEKAIPYDNAVNYSVTLKSHLIEKDGTYIFNDLIQSPEIWTEVNGETYRIILDSVSVDEDNRNDLYTATIKYKYSQSL